MADNIHNSDFMIERIKERPVNKRKLVRRMVITAAMAAVFGSISCVTFLLLEPVLNKFLYPEEESKLVVFPETQEEMTPEDMLSGSPVFDDMGNYVGSNNSLNRKQLQELLSEVALDKENYSQVYDAMSSYVTELNRSMVTITGVQSNVDWFNNVGESKNQSSGVIIANNGKELLVLADYTSLRKAESMTMTFSCLDYSVYDWSDYSIPVTLKGLDGSTNLAVLSARLEDIPDRLWETDGIQIAQFGSSNVRSLLGSPIIALGSPMGNSGSLDYGMITSIMPQSYKADSNFQLLQTNIYGSKNAGGVIFDLDGKVVGIITNQGTGTDMKNMVTAYGISELKKRIERISNGNKTVYLGISGMDVTEKVHTELGVPYGAFVMNTEMNSPAMLAGIQQGDVLTDFDGQSIDSYDAYITELMEKNWGNSVELTIMRAVQGEYKEMKIRVVLGTQ